MTNSELLKQVNKLQKDLDQLKEMITNRFQWAVYYHLLPNKKYYIGIAENTETRWANGEGYKTNTAFYKDIKQYSWSNIKHVILCKKETKREAEAIEKILISLFNATDKKYGYNKKTFFKTKPEDFTRRKGMFKNELQGLDLQELEETYQNKL